MLGSISRPDLPALTSLRFFAAAVVVAGHVHAERLDFLPAFAKAWAQSGYEAVTFFFVLSGFILVYVYSGAHEADGINVAPRKFLVARLARIGPAYYLALLLMLPAFVYAFVRAGIAPGEMFAPAVVLVPTLLQAWYPPVSFSWNGPAWSLSVELFFYLLFPVLLSKISRLPRGRCLAIAVSAVLASASLRVYLFSLDAAASENWRYFILYFPLFHLPSFVCGMALGRIYLFGPRLPDRAHTLLFLIGSAALMLLLGCRSELPTWLLTDILLVPLYGMVIFGAARMAGYGTRLLSIPGLVLLGEASYSVYILHTPVVFWWHRLTEKVLAIRLSGTAEVVIIFALVIGFSVLVFARFERPARRWILQYATPRHKIAPLQA